MKYYVVEKLRKRRSEETSTTNLNKKKLVQWLFNRNVLNLGKVKGGLGTKSLWGLLS